MDEADDAGEMQQQVLIGHVIHVDAEVGNMAIRLRVIEPAQIVRQHGQDVRDAILLDQAGPASGGGTDGRACMSRSPPS